MKIEMISKREKRNKKELDMIFKIYWKEMKRKLQIKKNKKQNRLHRDNKHWFYRSLTVHGVSLDDEAVLTAFR